MVIKEHKNFTKNLRELMRSEKKGYKEITKDRLKTFHKCKTNNIPLPVEFEDHGLNDNRRFRNCREFHICGDLIAIYKEEKDNVKLLDIGNHNNLLEDFIPDDEFYM